jgi:hypothetical protein
VDSITTYLDAKAIRDSQGRLYRERHRFGPANVDPESTLIEFLIDDPVSRPTPGVARLTRTIQLKKQVGIKTCCGSRVLRPRENIY